MPVMQQGLQYAERSGKTSINLHALSTIYSMQVLLLWKNYKGVEQITRKGY